MMTFSGNGEAKIPAIVAIDLSAAFDTVDQDILFAVLEKRFGMSENAIK